MVPLTPSDDSHRPPLISIPDAFRKAPSPTGSQSLLRQVTLGCVRRVSHHLCSKCTQQEHASAKSQAFRCRCLAPFSGVVLRLLDGPGYACGCNLTYPTCQGPEVESKRREARAVSPRSAPLCCTVWTKNKSQLLAQLLAFMLPSIPCYT